MKEYTVNYKLRVSKDGKVYETSVTADSSKEARELAKEEEIVILKVKLA